MDVEEPLDASRIVNIDETSGDDIQKISIIQSLPQLCSMDQASTYNRVIPKIQHDLINGSSEFQISTSRVFKSLIETKSNISLITSVVQGVDAKDPNVSSSWCDTLISLVPTLNEDVLKTTVIPLAKEKSAPNQPISSKVFASNLIGKLCIYPNFKSFDIKKDLLPLTLSLCQDCSPDVRAAICTNLPLVAQGVGKLFVKSNLLPSIIELASDENGSVRGASVVTISTNLQYLDNDTKKQTMVPLLKQLSEKGLRKNDPTAIILANEYGVLLKSLQKSIPPAEIEYFLKCYKSFSQMGKVNNDVKVDASKDVICRERCACNVILVLQFTMAVAPNQLPFIYGIFRELAADPCYLVRRSAAGTISKIAITLGNQNKMVKNEFVKLLRDDAVEVLDLLVPTISETLMSFCDNDTLSNTTSNQITSDIGRALFKCQTELSKAYNWRLTVTFLSQLECLPFCMPAEFIHNNFTPVLMDRSLNGKAKPIRIQSIRTLIVFLKYNFKENQHKWLRESLIKQLARSNSCYTRMLYFNCCEAVLNVFSEKYFKEFFLPPLIALATDRISNIRYGFVMFMSKLKNMVTFSTDLKTKQVVFEAFSKLEISEKNKDVLDLVRIKKRELTARRNEERLKEEDRRIAEESSGVIQRFVAAPVQQNVAAIPIGDGKRRNDVRIAQSEMTFLEKHFYTDAGVSIPKESHLTAEPKLDVELVEDVESEPTVLSDIKSLSDSEILNTTNITDDVKVNLRKIYRNKSKIVPPKTYRTSITDQKAKRYSSILSSNCIDRDKKTMNRRSLNLTTSSRSDLSKIPVCSRATSTSRLDTDPSTIRKSETSTKALELCDKQLSASDGSLEKDKRCSENVRVKSLSNLPILLRKNLVLKK
ncbi:PREDICTED: serine/threonine-protein phosphatase 4 regulatory subunit 4-like [Nicrophorus vespilloides]|uniref:Serine/threonine-protein phosphatase 4 regulatory subunit 4-like n=1 Tax=Nicrophorus vespilloides TaxID=110193 RepID=A0ABM1MT98_NICVS|nr:PREDICTED: serine/threonine-protein phosphatase 4 regulatory subunit 4-like [Nicrophorus vespilloides]